MQALKWYASFIAQYHTRTAHFSDKNDVDMIYQWWIHASLKLQFWNYHYHWHDILKYLVSTIIKQQNTLSTAFKSYSGSFFKFSKPWADNVTSKWDSESPSPLLKLVIYVNAFRFFFFFFFFFFFQFINKISFQSRGSFSRVKEIFVLHRCDSCAGAVCRLRRAAP